MGIIARVAKKALLVAALYGGKKVAAKLAGRVKKSVAGGRMASDRASKPE